MIGPLDYLTGLRGQSGYLFNYLFASNNTTTTTTNNNMSKKPVKEKEKEKEKRSDERRKSGGDFELIPDSASIPSSSVSDPSQAMMTIPQDIQKRLNKVESSSSGNAKKKERKKEKKTSPRKNALSKDIMLSDSDEEDDTDDERDDEKRGRRFMELQCGSLSSPSSLPDVQFDKARSQHEYQFLQHLMATLEDTQLSPEDRYIMLGELIEARAAILITAHEDGWGVAAELELFDNPKKAFLRRFSKDIDNARKRHSTKAKTKVVYLPTPSSGMQRTSSSKPTISSNGSLGSKAKGGGGGGDRRCYLCDSKDHFANRCALRKTSSSTTASASASSAGGSTRS